jgi:hypothetical protein
MAHVSRPSPKHTAGIVAPAPSTDDEPPAFCFKHARRGFQITDLNPEGKAAVLDTIHRLTELSWALLKRMGKQGGTEVIPRHRLRPTVPECVQDDDDILSIRVEKDTVFRLLGFRKDRLLHVLWIDPRGKCYPHGH